MPCYLVEEVAARVDGVAMVLKYGSLVLFPLWSLRVEGWLDAVEHSVQWLCIGTCLSFLFQLQQYMTYYKGLSTPVMPTGSDSIFMTV